MRFVIWTQSACLSSVQRRVWLLCGRKERWWWSWCVTSRPGLWRKPGVRLKSSRTMFSTSRPWWKRCSCVSRGNPLVFWKWSEILFTICERGSPVVQSNSMCTDTVPIKNSLPTDSLWSRMLTHFWDVPKRISKDEVSKVLFYFYLSIRFSYFIDKMTHRVCFCSAFHGLVHRTFPVMAAGATNALLTRQKWTT